MTHTDDDFRRADYFFCDGMDDPWLNEYVVVVFLKRIDLGPVCRVPTNRLTLLYIDYYLDI